MGLARDEAFKVAWLIVRKEPHPSSTRSKLRLLVAFGLCSGGALLGLFSLNAATLLEKSDLKRSESAVIVNPAEVPSLLSPANPLRPGVPVPATAYLAAKPPAVFPPAAKPALSLAPINQPLAANASGQWSVVNSPNYRTEAADNTLFGVTCVSDSDCWAVGHYGDQSANLSPQTLIEHWDGNAWSLVPSPNQGTSQANTLTSVACTSASDCWAVGYYGNTGTYRTLI